MCMPFMACTMCVYTYLNAIPACNAGKACVVHVDNGTEPLIGRVKLSLSTFLYKKTYHTILFHQQMDLSHNNNMQSKNVRSKILRSIYITPKNTIIITYFRNL